MLFSADELVWAAEVVGKWVPPTPQYVWPLLGREVGAEVWVKHENHTPTGAFKVRGGLVYAERMRTERPKVEGIVCAELIEHGHDFQAAREHAAQIGAERGLETVPSYHPDLILGVATYARELFDTAGELDAVYVPIGMGSGISGIIGVRDLLGLRTEVIGVVAEQAPATARSVAAGTVVTTETAETFVDGVACRVPDSDAIAVISAGAARVLAVSEDAAAEAMRVLFATTHNVAEPAGALALAGLLAERSLAAGKRVAVIHTGGNVDADMLLEVLSGHTPVA